MNRTKSIKYPDPSPSEVVYYAYDAGGNLCYVGNTDTDTCQTGGYAAYSGYNAAGQPGSVTYGNGVVTSYTYEPETMRLKTMQTTVLNGGASNYELMHTPYNWVTANTPTGITGDDQYAGFSLPFTFNFYGMNYTQAYFSSNGFASFGGGSTDYTPDPIPSMNAPNALAAGLWRDLNPSIGGCTGTACITYGSSSSQFAVSYNNVRNYSSAFPSRQTFQIVLNSDGSVVYQYAGLTNDVPTSVGVENQTGARGAAYGTPRKDLAIKATPVTGGTVAQNIRYDYDNAGNITAITDNVNGNRTQNFQYDDLNRLTQAVSGAYGTINYTYNEIGNMMTNSAVSAGTYAYDNPAHRHAVTAIPDFATYSYDANGNMTNRNGTTIAYDYDNRPTNIGGTTFVYDYAGQRVKKNNTVYIGQLYECTGGTCTKYIFAGGRRIAVKTGSTINYYHPDHLGGASVVTDNGGTKVEELHYYPFGGTRSDAGSVSLKHKYTGQELDSESGLYYYGARYYDPAIGRFISADTIVGNPSNPQSLNRYSYVLNNPLIYTDPSGHDAFSIMGSLIDGLVAAATFYVASGGGANPGTGAAAAGAFLGGSKAMERGTLEQVIQAAVQGAAIGAFIGAAELPWWYVIGTGAAISSIEGGWEGLYHFTAGAAGAMAAGYVMSNWVSTQDVTEDMRRIELVSGKPLRKSNVPPHIQEFFDNQYAKLAKMARDMNIDPDLLATVSAWETGWGTSRPFTEGHNRWGFSIKEKPIYYSSFDAGDSAFTGGKWPKRLSGPQSIVTFVEELGRSPAWNSVDSAYPYKIFKFYFDFMKWKSRAIPSL